MLAVIGAGSDNFSAGLSGSRPGLSGSRPGKGFGEADGGGTHELFPTKGRRIITRVHFTRAVRGIISAFQRGGRYARRLLEYTNPPPTLSLEAGDIFSRGYTPIRKDRKIGRREWIYVKRDMVYTLSGDMVYTLAPADDR